MAPNAWNLKYEEVIGLAYMSYVEFNPKKGDTYAFPKANNAQWTITDVEKRGSFHAITARGGNYNMCVTAYAGTDDLGDWADNAAQGLVGTSTQYSYALSYARSMHPDVVVGHSLGGGLASHVAVKQAKKCATINPAALNIIKAINMIRNGSLVINYVASGEALDILDFGSPMMSRVGQIYRVGSSGWHPFSRHQLSNLDGFQKPVRV